MLLITDYEDSLIVLNTSYLNHIYTQKIDTLCVFYLTQTLFNLEQDPHKHPIQATNCVIPK